MNCLEIKTLDRFCPAIELIISEPWPVKTEYFKMA